MPALAILIRHKTPFENYSPGFICISVLVYCIGQRRTAGRDFFPFAGYRGLQGLGFILSVCCSTKSTQKLK